MWFKKVLLGYCAASSALAIVTASNTRDATVSKSKHIVERLVFPSLQHRQEAARNRTSSVETLVSISSTVATTSSSLETPNVPKTSDPNTTPIITITLESASSITPKPVSSTKEVSSTPAEASSSSSSSSNGAISSSLWQTSTESTVVASSATNQPTPGTPISVSSRVETSESVPPSTTFQVPSPTSSYTIEVSSLSISEVPSNTGPVNGPTPAPTSDILSSSELTTSSIFSSVSTPIAETSQATSDVLTPSSTDEVLPSATSVFTPSPPVTESGTTVTSTPYTSTAETFTSTITGQQSPPPSSALPISTSLLQSSISIQESFSSSILEVSTSLPQESATASITEQIPTPTSVSASSSGAAQVSSSQSQGAEPPISSTIADATSSVQTSSSSSTASSTLEDLSSVIETQIPSSSTPEPIATPVTSTAQPSPASAEPISSSALVQSSQISSNVLGVTTSPVSYSTGPSAVSSTLVSSTSDSEQSPSSSLVEFSSSFWSGTGISSSTISPESTALSTLSTSLVSSQTGPVPSETLERSSSFTSVLSSQSASVVTTGTSLVLTPTPTVIDSSSSAITSQQSKLTGFFGTGASSSTTLESSSVFSLMPSETLVRSTQSPIASLASTSTLYSQSLSSSAVTLSNTHSDLNEQSLTATVTLKQSSSNSMLSGSQTITFVDPTSVAISTPSASSSGPIPTSETAGSISTISSVASNSTSTPTSPGISSLASTGASVPSSLTGTPLMSSAILNGTQSGIFLPVTTGSVTATFSTVYTSSIRPSVIDLSTVVFSLLNTVTEAAVNQTATQVPDKTSSIISSAASGTRVPASESLMSSSKLGSEANSTWTSSIQSSMAATSGLPSSVNGTTTSTADQGITFRQSASPTGTGISTSSSTNATEAGTLQTTSMERAANSTTAGFIASTTLGSASSVRTDGASSMSASDLSEASRTSSDSTGNKGTPASSPTTSGTPSRTPAAGSPPPLTTSQTAGVAVGATTGLLIAVVAAVFIARRYHAAKHGKRMSTGSVYPKVAYIYDPNTGGDSGDTEALMSGGTGGPPGGPVSGMTQGSPRQPQRYSTGTFPVTRFTSPGNPFAQSVRDPAVHRYSEYARLDTARALSAAVAGYGARTRHSSSYTKHPSQGSNAFSDHVIPSPTFAPFSPDDIRRPELKRSPNPYDGRGEYSQMSPNPYAYLNTAASMYPPISPYEPHSTQGTSPYSTSRQSIDSDPFTDPFEHDVLLHIDERNRTSDSVTIFAPSPNLLPPRTPRTPVGPKLPIKHANGMTSARSLLSPVAAKYIQKAQEVKIPRKSVASPVLVQVGGRSSPVIKPFSPPPAAPEPRGWDAIKRQSEKHFSDEQSVPAPLKFAAPLIKRKPVSTTSPSHTGAQPPQLTGTGALAASVALPLTTPTTTTNTVNIPPMYNKSVVPGLDVPRAHHARPGTAPDDVSSDPIVREKRSRELRFADPALIGREF
ncbi:hypothetical protein E8E13_009091 [Curvularia kusanoi]|uniref:Sox C-terminal domain-containing protein n=1 Tax=Curvularia kusanoi TaxID=90978 RepID=A0A9P4TIE0_CURKU|nr:hypothetical protein E8E13_009091 [Curvularia kusanoi]